ncbi:PH domain-containing protein [Sphingopyxis fribergensis]
MSEAAVVMPAIVDEPDWQRLHPATLALALVKLGPRSLQFLPAIAALGFTGNWIWIVPAIGAFLAISLLAAWFQWLRFRFAVGDDEVVIESGVLSRQHRTIPFDRIQDVSIEQGLVSRALGIAKVGFETGAGGKENDASLDAIALGAAQALRTTIRAHRSGEVAAPVTADSAEAAPVAEDRLLFAMGPRQLLVAGLFNFSLAALAVVGAGMQFFDGLLPFDFNVFNPMDWIDIAEDYGLDQWLLAHRWIAGVGAALSLLLIGFASGIATMVFANWDFRLTREPRALRRTRGLTTRTDVAVPVRRVQAAILVTGWLRQRFGWHELRLQSLASDGEKERDHQVVPFAKLDAIDPVLAEVAILRPDAAQPWQHSHRIVALGGLIGAVCAATGGLVAVSLGQPLGWFGPVAGLLIGAGSLFGARFHRWADLGEQVAIRRGAWKPKLTLLPHASVQSVDLKSDFILRPLGLATLVFGVPGGSSLATHEIPAIPLATAHDLRTRILAARARS